MIHRFLRLLLIAGCALAADYPHQILTRTAIAEHVWNYDFDNLTNLILRDSEKRDYEPTAVLDYTGVRRYLSAF